MGYEKDMLCFCANSPAGAVPLHSCAMAATEYGVIYDETEELSSQTLTIQGEQTLPQLSEKLGLDLRVDVLTQISYDTSLKLLPGSMPDTITAMAKKRTALA